MASKTRVAVHYNFDLGKLSIRAIRPSGSLGALLGTATDVTLADCEFTCDRAKWQRWKSGAAKNVRQFAEVRGVIVDEAPDRVRWHDISFDPRQSPDFRRADNQSIRHAAFARISGRSIAAARPSA